MPGSRWAKDYDEFLRDVGLWEFTADERLLEALAAEREEEDDDE